ncbi:MAG TPA: glycosyltransferase [Vicinamibacteria bacterium]|nr:glycosyltransferase [Vicinamibacteria bacterium]
MTKTAAGRRLEVLVPADIRFPLERASGVQIVKTAAALAGTGARTTLLVRQSDPRPTPEILALYGIASPTELRVRRLRVLHRRGAFAVPRASFLARAALAAIPALGRGAAVLTRDLQLADVLLRLPGRPRVVYEAHAVEALMYGERAALYGTSEKSDPRKRERLAKREGRVWRAAAAVVTTTAGIRDSFAESYGERPRVRVVPNGCDPAAGPFPGLPEGEPEILYAGQLYPWKGVDVLVQAFASVTRGRLVILGGIEGEKDTARVRALVDRLGLAGRVDMPGLVPQARVAEALGRATVVVVPFLRTAMTERHTSPLKAFEAMAAGRAIVASDLPSTREVLRHGQTAWLVAPGDPAALADGLRRLVDDRALALTLARAAFEAAPAYAWPARARALVEVLEDLR